MKIKKRDIRNRLIGFKTLLKVLKLKYYCEKFTPVKLYANKEFIYV